VPVPEPGAGQVLIKIGGAGACHTRDLHVLEAPPKPGPKRAPFTFGHENAGWVDQVRRGFAKEEADPDGADVIYTASGVSNVPASFVCADSADIRARRASSASLK
jgi:D-arabinose 1-dehydrogenase-like Zn-dependent alcohol dehydrogenase